MKAIPRRWERWLLVLLWMGAIFVVSGRPSADLPVFGLWDTLVKKSGHFVAYGILAWLIFWAIDEQRRRSFVWALVLTAVYASSDEFHQTFVPGRQGTLVDVIIDVMGGMAALQVYYWWRRDRHHSF